jgi:hypothetical protein
VKLVADIQRQNLAECPSDSEKHDFWELKQMAASNRLN